MYVMYVQACRDGDGDGDGDLSFGFFRAYEGSRCLLEMRYFLGAMVDMAAT